MPPAKKDEEAKTDLAHPSDRDRGLSVAAQESLKAGKLVDYKNNEVELPDGTEGLVRESLREGEVIGSYRVDAQAMTITIATRPNGRKYCLSYAK